jgi:hypothetical protein
MELKKSRTVIKSFYDWCVENNRMDLNDRFDENKNQCTTKDVAYKSNQKWWFKCHRGIHDSELRTMCVVTSNPMIKLLCKKCNSLAQVVVDKFGEEYLWSHWHTSNLLDPWDISYGNDKIKVTIQCQAKDYHVYQQVPQSFSKGIGCPYCKGRLVHPEDSLAALHPDIVNRWSNKNIKSPYEYTVQSGQKAWLTCPIGKHDDYLQMLSDAARYKYRCPGCSLDEVSNRMSGANNYFWKGGINGENDNLRHRREYKDWRTSVYERDNYTCQCCGRYGGKLNAHHINSFSDYIEFRYDVHNGITLCESCHDSSNNGSFHNTYWTHNNTPSQLRQYILDKSNKDIYITNPNLLYQIPLLPSDEFEFD